MRVATLNANLTVEDKNYSADLSEGATAFDLMKKAEEQGFSFSGKEYTGMGFFVEEINGKKNDSEKGLYWTMYVNGTLSPVGVSGYMIKEGDKIEWKHEKVNF